MFEIELKAHVPDRNSLIRTLDEFAEYIRSVKKSDEYYHLSPCSGSSCGEKYVSVRVRTETQNSCTEKNTVYYLTYKKKELRQNCDGTSFELNDEKETVLSNADAVLSLLHDSGFVLSLRKEKEAEVYKTQTEYGEATLELCTVSGLGDFLEIEILSQTAEEQRVRAIQAELKRLLLQCGIPLKNIEPNYYSELLAQKKADTANR